MKSSYDLDYFIKNYKYDKKNYYLRVHGSGIFFEKEDLNHTSGYMDFGPGFYLTDDFSHAERRAIDKAVGKGKRKGTGEGYVYFYLVPKHFPDFINYHKFQGPNISWVDFIMKNRDNSELVHNYDVVVGPTADAFTTSLISDYYDGVFGVVDSDKAKEQLGIALKTNVMGTQTCITSYNGLNLIKRLNYIRVY